MSIERVEPKGAILLPDGLPAEGARPLWDTLIGSNLSDAMIDEWGRQSFPASDPPSNW